MSQEPKKRHSKQRQGKRRASIALAIPQTVSCDNCGSSRLPHTVCPSCGYYKKIAVITKTKTQPKFTQV